MKSNEIDGQDDQLRRLANLWPTLTPRVRRSIVALVEGSIKLQQLNRGAGGVRPRRNRKLPYGDYYYDNDNDKTESFTVNPTTQ